jgi:hypothetical protein
VKNFINSHLFLIVVMTGLSLFGCSDDMDTPDETESEIHYRLDGRSVEYGDPFPIALDVNDDATIDFSIFVELTANSAGDHLYVAVNPLAGNQMKGTAGDDNRFLNMGLAISQSVNHPINETNAGNEQWSPDFLALVIRHTPTSANDPVYYEGEWQSGQPTLAGIKVFQNGSYHFGWLRLTFDKNTEVIRLVDYAFNVSPNVPIKAGQLE